MTRKTGASTITDSRRSAGRPIGPRQFARRKSELIDASRFLLIAQKQVRASIDDICKVAGVAKGTFYHYFGDRRELLHEVLSAHSFDVAKNIRSETDLECQLCGINLVEFVIRQVAKDCIDNSEFYAMTIFGEEGLVCKDISSLELAKLLEEVLSSHGARQGIDYLEVSKFTFLGLVGLIAERDGVKHSSEVAAIALSVLRGVL